MDLLTLIAEHQQMKQDLAQMRQEMERVKHQPLALEWITENQAVFITERSRGWLRKYAGLDKDEPVDPAPILSNKRGGARFYSLESINAFMAAKAIDPEYTRRRVLEAKQVA